MKYKVWFTVLFLVFFGCADCQLNVTETYNETSESETEVSSTAPNWCPPNTLRLEVNGMWYLACNPSPCLWTDVKYPNISSNVTFVPYVNETARQICTVSNYFGDRLSSPECHRVRLSSGQFRLNYTDGSLFELRTNETYVLGEYFYYEATNEAMICRKRVLDEDDTYQVEFKCMPYQPKLGEYEMMPNGSVYLRNFKRLVRKGYYSLKNDSKEVEWVCLGMGRNLENCVDFTSVSKENLKLLPDLTLYTDYAVVIDYSLGDYFLAADHSDAYVCVESGLPRRPETRYLYTTAYVISVVFISLTLLVHLMYPKLNYHAKALLCHIISLFVMYVVMTIRSFVIDYHTNGFRLFIFSLQYVSALSAFFWLNVLAYELWKVFSSLQGSPGTIGSQRLKRRWFIIKCLYAWGIPIAMCSLAIGLSYEPSTSKFLDLTLSNEGLSWFDTSTSLFVLFYVPIIIVLLENIVFFGLTIYNIRKTSQGTQILNKKVSRKLFRVFVKLFVVMGICWFAEVISWALVHKADEAVWYLTDLINCLQGVAIFLIYVCKRSTWIVIKKRWTGESSTGKNGTKSTSSSADSRGRKISTISNTAITMTNMKSTPNNQLE